LVLVLLAVGFDSCSVSRKSALNMEVLVAVAVAVDAGQVAGIPDIERDVLGVLVGRMTVAAVATTVFEVQ
jgi:hypothetical protein